MTDSKQFVREVLLPDIVGKLRDAIQKITGVENVSMVMLMALDADGTVFSTVSRAEALALITDAADKIALELAHPYGPAS